MLTNTLTLSGKNLVYIYRIKTLSYQTLCAIYFCVAMHIQDKYTIFEVIRSHKEGGSLITGVHDNFSPVLIYENEILKILVVQINIGSLLVRLINAYGPQEYENIEKVIEFYSIIDQKIQMGADLNVSLQPIKLPRSEICNTCDRT